MDSPNNASSVTFPAGEATEEYPSYQSLASSRILVVATPATRQLFWTLASTDVSASVFVIPSPRRSQDISTDLEPLLDRHRVHEIQTEEEENDIDAKWHQIAEQPVTEPKVSKITICVDELDTWAYHWTEEHLDHDDGDFDMDGDEGDVSFGGPGQTFERDEDDDEGTLVACCGEARPREPGEKLEILAGAEGRGWVSVRDYVEQLHPWLMERRRDVWNARNVSGAYGSLDEMDVEAKEREMGNLMVNYDGVARILISTREEWINFRTGMERAV